MGHSGEMLFFGLCTAFVVAAGVGGYLFRSREIANELDGLVAQRLNEEHALLAAGAAEKALLRDILEDLSAFVEAQLSGSWAARILKALPADALIQTGGPAQAIRFIDIRRSRTYGMERSVVLLRIWSGQEGPMLAWSGVSDPIRVDSKLTDPQKTLVWQSLAPLIVDYLARQGGKGAVQPARGRITAGWRPGRDSNPRP